MPSACVRETMLEKHVFYLIFYLQTNHVKTLNFNKILCQCKRCQE
jgi:hypothetical protein